MLAIRTGWRRSLFDPGVGDDSDPFGVSGEASRCLMHWNLVRQTRRLFHNLYYSKEEHRRSLLSTLHLDSQYYVGLQSGLCLSDGFRSRYCL